MNYSLKQLTNPSVEPVSVSQVKNWCAVDHDDDDESIAESISAARKLCEDHTDLVFGSRTFQLKYANWPCNEDGTGDIRFPVEPVTSVDSIKYTDSGAIEHTATPNTDFRVWLEHSPPLVRFTSGFSRVSLESDNPSPLVVEFTAGTSEVPAKLVQAIKLTIEYWRSNPGGERNGDNSSRGLPAGAIRLLDSMWTGSL